MLLQAELSTHPHLGEAFLPPGYMVITYTILDGTALLYVNGEYLLEVPAPPNGTIIDTVSMSPAQSVMAPGAAALGIPFVDNRAWSAESNASVAG